MYIKLKTYLLAFLSLFTSSSFANTDLNSSQINYITPERQYQACSNDYNIMYEIDPNESLNQRGNTACKQLEQRLHYILSVYPAHTRNYFQSLKYYVLTGDDGKLAGNKSGLRYVRPNEPSAKNLYDPRWQNAVIIYSSKNYLDLDALWQIKSVAHELAHAWHIKNWPEKYPLIYDAWQNANDLNLYQNVEDYKGRKIPQAYALQNQLEYFAEISVAYFFKIDYFPYNQQNLQSYDPIGYYTIQHLWQSLIFD